MKKKKEEEEDLRLITDAVSTVGVWMIINEVGNSGGSAM
jgi:hypothetical protein